MNSLAIYEAKKILPRIKAILSMKDVRKGDFRSWIKQNKFDDDMTKFYTISDDAIFKLNTHWTRAILAALPEKFWSCLEGVNQLDLAGSEASLRLLSTTWRGDCEQKELILHQAARKQVMQALFDNLSEPVRSQYQEMLSWIEKPGIKDGEVFGDTGFGWMLHRLEIFLEQKVAQKDLDWRIRFCVDESKTTPVDVRQKFSEFALMETCDFIERNCEYGKSKFDTPESLLVLLSVNMSCNKKVLEYAAMNKRACEALEMTVSFLRELNAHGVEQVPPEFDFLNVKDCDDAIFRRLQSWFGHNGEFISLGTSFAKHMTNSDIQLLVDLSRELQSEYIATRGSSLSLPLDQVQTAHSSSTNRFIFALVLAGAFYTKARTDHEFVVGKNASYAVFPDRKSIKQGHQLTIHAKNMLLKAYGLIYFGGQGWNLTPHDIEQYAKGTETRRSHIQLALLLAVKGRTCKELMGLYEAVK